MRSSMSTRSSTPIPPSSTPTSPTRPSRGHHMAKIDKTGRRPKRLTRLKISEVSAVDRGAGEGVRVVFMKRAGGKRFRFNDADSLVPGDDDQADVGKSSLDRALAEIAEHHRFVKAHPLTTPASLSKRSE